MSASVVTVIVECGRCRLEWAVSVSGDWALSVSVVSGR